MGNLPQTIPGFLAETVARRGDERALGFMRGGELQWRTWREVAEDAAGIAAAVRAARIGPGDRVAQVSENRYGWIVTDLALHLAAAVHVPIHVTLSGQQIAEQIADCGARMVFVSSGGLLAKFAPLLNGDIAVWIHDEQQLAASQQAADLAAKNLSQNRLGEGDSPIFPRGLGKIGTVPDGSGIGSKPQAAADELATILYTSGTTGRPRGVMLSQRNLASNAATLAEAHGSRENQTRLCILPLSHIYARTCDLYTWVYRGSRLVLAEGRETLARDCQLVRPTALSAVPYVYQRIADRIRAAGASDESKALASFFGGRIERLSCGGAPLAPETEAWYAERGLPVLPGYGLTEAAPVVSTSTTSCWRRGSVGRPLPNVEVRIDDDGEILVRGPNVMRGYWQDEAATAETIRDGWLQTGDLGELDADGFLYIRGRKKELVVLSTGKKVSPTRLESMLAASPLIEQAAVFGDGQPALVALIVPADCGSARSEERGAKSEAIALEIKRCLAAAAGEEQVRRFAIVDRPFSIERGELTAKLSLCRDVIARNFAAELAELAGRGQARGATQATAINV